MSRSLGPRLPDALVARLDQRDVASRLGVALPLATVDADGRPHPMLLSYLEVRAHGASRDGTGRYAIALVIAMPVSQSAAASSSTSVTSSRK